MGWPRSASKSSVAVLSALAVVTGHTVAQSVLWEVAASSPATVFGESVVSAGDVDGDGLDDLLVGEPGFDPGGMPDAGRIRLYSSSDQTVLLDIVGSHAGAGLGSILGRPGDLTGDGIPEIVARVFQGGPPATPWMRVYSGAGTWISESVGNAGSVVGDLDGDGVSEVVVGHWDWPAPACTADHGRAYAVSGGAGGVLAQWEGWPCAGEAFGFEVAPLGDVSGDGLPDFAVSSAGNSSALMPASLFLYSGLNTSPVWSQLFYEGPFLSAPPAQSIAAAGDVDGDGVGDVLAGFWQAGPTPSPPGIARVLSGASGAILHVFVGNFPDQRLGKSVGRLGDLDGDGYADLLVGGPRFPFWYAPTPPSWPTAIEPGRVHVFSGNTGIEILQLVEPPPGEGFGTAVDGVSDLDGDDYPDFAVGHPWRHPPNPGRVIGYSGAPAGVSPFGSGCPGGTASLPRIAGWPSAALGAAFAVNLSLAPPNAPALLLLGFSSSTWVGIPLPLDLGFLGMAGCDLLVSPDLVLAAATRGPAPGMGRASVPLSIPAVPALGGGTFYAQWAALSGTSPLAASWTRGLAVTIQP